MTVFKGILLHFWKYKILILILLAAFFGFAIMFSQGNSSDNYDSESLRLKVIDHSQSDISRGLIEYLNVNNEAEIINEEETDIEALEEEIFLSAIDGFIIIPPDAQSRFMDGEPVVETTSDRRTPKHLQLQTAIQQYFMFLKADFDTTGTLHPAEITELLSESIDVKIHESVDVEAQSNFDYMKNYTNFAGYWIMLFLLIIVGNVMSEFNSPELKQRINVSPMKTGTFMYQMIISQIVVGLVVVTFMFFGAVALRSGELSGVPLGKMLAALILITAFTLSIHYVIGALTTNKFIINGLANFIAIGMAFLSGVMMPLEVMGETAQNIAQYLPLYHFTQIYAEADITWSESAFPMLVVALYTIAFLIIGMIVENKRKISS